MESDEKKPSFTTQTKKWLIILAAAIALVLTSVFAAAAFWNSMLNKLGDPEETVPTLSAEAQEALLGTMLPTEETAPENTWPNIKNSKNITNIMLVGQNFREDEQNKLSDTMILCSINKSTNTMTMVSFLRDTFVPLPAYAGHGPGANRINVCYALGSTWKRSSLGGMEMLALCVEQNFGIHVDHTIEVGFESFPAIIDAVGGVQILISPEEAQYMTDHVGYIGEVQPGLQTLDGLQALAFARIRAIGGDVQRTARQREVISSLITKCRDMNLMDLYNMVNAVLPMIITDMTNEEITKYIFEFLPLAKDIQLQSLTCPVDNQTLPGSMWSEMIELYGYPASIIRCNIPKNREFLQNALGIEYAAK